MSQLRVLVQCVLTEQHVLHKKRVQLSVLFAFPFGGSK